MFKISIFTNPNNNESLVADMKEKRKVFKKISFRKHKKSPPGSAPGMIAVSPDAAKPVIMVHYYNRDVLEMITVTGAAEIRKIVDSKPGMTFWIEIRGFGDKNFFEALSDLFSIHRLEMEDVLSGYQRPKMEESQDHIFLVSRPVFYHEDEMQDDQLSIFVSVNYVISIQEKLTDYFAPVKERLKQNKGIIRTSGSSYIGYALMDAVVDNYFPFLEKLGISLDDLEDRLLGEPGIYSLQHIQAIKRKLIVFRRIAWSEREKLNDLLRTPSPLFSDTARRYARDTYDHTIQVMDIIESYREITASLMDIYLSSVSNRLNKVMKVLTIISTIFIPLTFIVGLYGMNFSRIDPDTGKVLPLNMPELYSPYGYVSVIIAMLLIVFVQIFFFYKKGWLDFRDRNY